MTTPLEFFLEAELLRAYHMIDFLRNCLEHPETYKYTYPEHVERRLEEIEAYVGKPTGGCPHSYYQDGCDSCEKSKQQRELARQYAEELGWELEPGRWPTPRKDRQ